MSSPDVKTMTKSQWVFEAHALQMKESEDIKCNIEILKSVLVSVLGLNSLRPTNESGVPKDFDSMTPEERKEFLPLVSWIGHPELLKKVSEQYQDLSAIEDTDAEYEKLAAAIDANDGDMEPILGAPIPAPKVIPEDNITKNLLTVEDDI